MYELLDKYVTGFHFQVARPFASLTRTLFAPWVPSVILTLPFTSSFAEGFEAPIPTFPEEIEIAPANPFTCETMSFHAVVESCVPVVAFGNAHQVAAPYVTMAQKAASPIASPTHWKNQRTNFRVALIGFA